MKNLSFILLCLLSFFAQGQSNFSLGLKGGVNLTFLSVIEDSFGEITGTEVGYYGGLFLDFEIEDKFSIQPELLYIGLNDFKFLNAPIYTKYEVAHNLDVMVGPSINYFFDFFTNKVKIRADLSTAYNITPTFDVHMKYTIGFQEITPNGLFLGVGYRL